MRELDIDLSDRKPKRLSVEMQLHADWAVTMGCGDACPYVPTTVDGARHQRARRLSPAWSSSEDTVMRWAAHFWDVDRWPATFPHVFETYYFRRWITACHLYKRITPALPSDTGGER